MANPAGGGIEPRVTTMASDGGFTQKLARMVLHSSSWPAGDQTGSGGDVTEGLRLLEGRLASPGIVRAAQEVSFAPDHSAIHQSLVVDLDSTRLEVAATGAATWDKVVLASYPNTWITPTVHDGAGGLISTCVRSELNPHLAAAAIELLSLAWPLDPAVDVPLLQRCAERVLDPSAWRIEETRGLKSVRDKDVSRVLRGSRPSTPRIRQAVAWLEGAASKLDLLGESSRVAPLLCDLIGTALIVVPCASVPGRQRIRIEFPPSVLRDLDEGDGRGLRPWLGRVVRSVHTTRDVTVPFPDLSGVVDNQVIAIAPGGLEFAPAFLVRRGRLTRNDGRPRPERTATLDESTLAAMPAGLLRLRLDSLFQDQRALSHWITEMVESGDEVLRTLGTDVDSTQVMREHLSAIIDFEPRLHQLFLQLQDADEKRRAARLEAAALGQLEAELADLEASMREVGYRATIFPDESERPDILSVRLPPRMASDQSMNLELRLHARLQPSQRMYFSIMLSTAIACALTLLVTAHLIMLDESDLAAEFAGRADAVVTLLVFVPAALFGAILTSASGGLTKELLRHWIALFAVFGAMMPLLLAVAIGTMSSVPALLLWVFVFVECGGLAILFRSTLIRRLHQGLRPPGRLASLVQRALRLPDPSDLVRDAVSTAPTPHRGGA